MCALVSRVHGLSDVSSSDEFAYTKDSLAALVKDCAALRKKLETQISEGTDDPALTAAALRHIEDVQENLGDLTYSYHQLHTSAKSVAHAYDRYKSGRADEQHEEAEATLFSL